MGHELCEKSKVQVIGAKLQHPDSIVAEIVLSGLLELTVEVILGNKLNEQIKCEEKQREGLNLHIRRATNDLHV